MRTFDLVLTGRILPGFDPNATAAALAKMLHVPEEKARELLAGRETPIKRGLPEDQMPPYVEALRRCGAEVRATEVLPDKVKCPACGTEQQPRNLCRQCGADMKRVAAAQEAARKPPEAKIAHAATVSAVVASRIHSAAEPPLYRRTWWIEVLFFFFLTPYWAWKMIFDRERGAIAQVVGVLVMIGFSVQLYMLVNDIRQHGWLGEEGAVIEAVRYAVDMRKQVDEFAYANRRFPESGEIPVGKKPWSVETVEVGPRGRVRVVLGQNVKESPGGAITLTPVIDDKGSMRWECRTMRLQASFLAKQCTMRP